MRTSGAAHESFARFVDERGKRGGRGRTKLFFPPSDADTLSVFTATGALKADLERAGLHVAHERGRSRLYGWYLTDEPTYREHGLRVEPNRDGLSFGACRHMDVRGWPNELDKRLVIAQALGEASRYKALDPPIAVAQPAQPT